MDYIVPMPMTEARFQEYIDVYDLDLNASCVVVDEENDNLIHGLGMLGVRSGRSWITRLGVLPYSRRLGTGRRIMDFLILKTKELGLPDLWLEVIQGNDPARKFFEKLGFEHTRELMVARRPPTQTLPDEKQCLSVKTMAPLDIAECIDLLATRKNRPNWLNETESFSHVKKLIGSRFELADGAGWLIYEPSLLQLKRVTVEVTAGDDALVSQSILCWLHHQFPRLDAISENIPADDPRWKGYEAVGYFDSFRRLEMLRDMSKPYQARQDQEHRRV